MVHAFDMGRQQLTGDIQGFLNVFKGFNLDSQQRIDHGQIISRVGKLDFGIGVIGIQRSLIFSFHL